MTKQQQIPDDLHEPLREALYGMVDEIIERRCRQLDVMIVLAALLLGGFLALLATECGWI